MGALDSIGQMLVNGVGGSIGSLAKDIRTAITGKEAVTADERQRILDRVAEIEKTALQADRSIIAGQLKINEIEAASSSIFKGGWRPAVGWVCVMALFYTFLVKPLLPWILTVASSAFGTHFTVPDLPVLDIGSVIALLGGMLGLGGFRTFEKLKGVN